MGVVGTSKEFELYRQDAIAAARDLGYSYEIIDRIRHAKTDIEISRIMATARHTQISDLAVLEVNKRRNRRRF